MADVLPETTLVEFIQYNNWANRQVLEACRRLSEDQLAAATPSAYGSIRDTMAHILRSEAAYVRLLTGLRPQPSFKWEDRPGIPEMTLFADQIGEALTDAAKRVRPTDLVHQDWDGKQVQYRALALFIQIVNHDIEHRTNITTILNQGLQTPPDVDGWGYLWAHPDRLDLE